MALFTDGPVSGMEDLMAQDTQLLNLVNVEQIDLTQKLRLAQDELALELEELLNESRSSGTAIWRCRSAGIESVVTTPALKLWHTYRTLEMVYRDAYANQLNDRYAAKRDQFRERAKWAHNKLVQVGIGMAQAPLQQATQPLVVNTVGQLGDGTYYLAVAWTNDAGEEGMPSAVTAITTVDSTLMVQPGVPPAAAKGWNVYAGPAPQGMYRQNDSPLAVDQTWLQPDTLRSDGSSPGTGQSPGYLKPVPQRILRG